LVIRNSHTAHTMASHHMKITYWGMKSRVYLPLLLLHKGGLKYDWDKAENWPNHPAKAVAPFGQLPLLQDGDVVVAQSLAVARYISRKAHLQGETDAEFATSEMLIQEMEDIYLTMAMAMYHADKADAAKKARETTIPGHFAHLEKLLHHDTFTGKVLAGDLAIWAGIDMVVSALNPHAVDNYPKLKKFYEHLSHDSGVKEVIAMNLPSYFKFD